FTSRIRNAVGLSDQNEILNASQPTRTAGTEFLARLLPGEFNIVLAHAFVHSTEIDLNSGNRQLVPLTPKHTSTIDFLWEQEGKGRIGLEAYYIGEQQLEHNPYRTHSIPYWVFGVLLEHRFGSARVFFNAEN